MSISRSQEVAVDQVQWLDNQPELSGTERHLSLASLLPEGAKTPSLPDKALLASQHSWVRLTLRVSAGKSAPKRGLPSLAPPPPVSAATEGTAQNESPGHAKEKKQSRGCRQ